MEGVKRMSYIILDLEWNQAFKSTLRIKEPVYLIGEIIQIGAVKVNENGKYLDNFKIGVKPRYYKRMHEKVTRLTGIENEDLQYGFDFSIAFQHFKKWCGEEAVFLTWGNDDIDILSQNMQLHNIETMEYSSYDLQIIFDDQIGHLNRRVSLQDAVEMVGAVKRRNHDACCDALSTYDIFSKLDIEIGIENYNQIEKRFNTKESICSDVYEFPDGLNYLFDDKFRKFTCPCCQEEHYCGEWIKQNADKYLALGECKTGEKFVLRVKKKKFGKTQKVRKIIYSYEELGEYYEKMVFKSIEKQEKARLFDEEKFQNMEVFGLKDM